MKKLLLFIIACCSVALTYAQKVYFIYLQSENYSPFYVKMSDKVYSSTSDGYLILSMLKDSTYSFWLGQPGKQAEPKFAVTINKADRGFLVKNTEGQFNLVDLQTQTVYKPTPVENKISLVRLPENLFTNLLARAADDSSLLYESVALQQTNPPLTNSSTAVVAINENSAIDNKTSEQKPIVITAQPRQNTEVMVPVTAQPVAADVVDSNASSIANGNLQQMEKELHSAEFVRSTVLRKSESSTTEGFGLVYLDNHNGVIDTIKILIPNPKMSFPQVNNSKPSVEEKRFLEMKDQQPAAPKNNKPDDAGMKQSTTYVEPRQKSTL